MPLSVHIEAFGETVVQRDLLRFGHNVVNMKPAMEEAGDIMRAAVRQQFATEGTHGGSHIPWQRLAASTLAHKARLGLSLEILRATSRLFRSLTGKGEPEHIERASEDSLRFGTLVPYAMFHQSSRPRTKIPFRPPVGLSEGDKRAIVHAIQKRAMEGVGG